MKKCLIVDDSKIVRAMARRIIQDLGFHIDEAENGMEALKKCRDSDFAVILLDWNMPVMNGIDFLKTLRSENLAGAPKVVFCSTENSSDAIKRGLDTGADAYLVKPFDKEAILSKFGEANIV